MDTSKAERTRREILRLCHAGLDAQALRLALVKALRAVTPVDAFWAATVDPATLLFTGSVIEAIPEHATPAFLANEFLADDANKFVALARHDAPVNTLSVATDGDLGRSARYREILAPLGLGDELRAALVSDGACWGVLCLHRQRGDPAYSAADIAFLRQLAPHLAEGLRTALLLDRADAVPGADGPGVLLLADDFSVIATTPAAAGWLAELSDWPRREEAPQAVRAVAARLWALERAGTPAPGLLPRVRVALHQNSSPRSGVMSTDAIRGRCRPTPRRVLVQSRCGSRPARAAGRCCTPRACRARRRGARRRWSWSRRRLPRWRRWCCRPTR